MKQRSLARLILEGIEGVVILAAAVLSWPLSKRGLRNWGATAAELERKWPGDSLVSQSFEAHTRAIEIAAPPPVVWSWVVQFGFGRAGFYSYEFLERLIGIPVTNIESIEPEMQSLAIGDEVILHPKAPAISVGLLEPGRYICFGKNPGSESHPHRSWSFYVEPGPRDSCRLVLRGCIERPHDASLLQRFATCFAAPVDFVMEQRMLRTVKRLAENGNLNRRLMKAVVFTNYGSPDRLQLKEVPTPSPKDDEVLVRVQASSINSWDWEFLRGTPFINRLMHGLFKPRPGSRILGSDMAGTVEAVGPNARRFQPGDEVFGDLWDNWGGFAEYACASEAALERKPANVTFENAAAVPQAGVLALQALRIAGEVKPGQKVLINGAGGGVGTYAIQLAKLSGTEVTGVDASHKLDVVRSVGADHIIDYAQEDFTATGKQYDRVIDCQNFRSASDNKRALRPGGVYAMVGGSIPRVYQLWFVSFVDWLTGDSKKLRLVAVGPNKGLGYLKELIEAGKLTPIVDSTYPLSEVPEAMRYFGEGRHRGKIAVSVNSESPRL